MANTPRFIQRDPPRFDDDDDDYSVPPPPPPKQPHPDDTIMIESLPTYTGDSGSAADPDGMLIDNMSPDKSEAPPSTFDERTPTKEHSKENGLRRVYIFAVLCSALILLAIILGIGFGTGAFRKAGASKYQGASSHSPTLSPASSASRASRMAKYLSTQAADPTSFGNSTSANSLALNWLINNDPLQLDPAIDPERVNQRYALLMIWFLSPIKWKNATGWLHNENECTWYGVRCNSKNLQGGKTINAVVALEMDYNSIEVLPLDISLLTSLAILSMQGNGMSGYLPYTLFNMSSLVEIYFDNNYLSQDITNIDFSGMTNLEILRLGDNRLKGQLSDSLWTLAKLDEIILDNNQITGTLSSKVDLLPNLTILDLSFNNFTGSLPTQVGSVQNLTVLSLGFNGFVGSVPGELNGLVNLKELNLEQNNFTGTVPRLSNLNLVVLRIGGNQFDKATIPTFIYYMPSLEVLGLNGMKLQGSIDTVIGNLFNLKELNLENNLLYGAVPTQIRDLTSLNILTMQNNFFTGRLNFTKNMVTIFDLDVSNNAFSGSIPDLSGLTNLTRLQVQENKFGGTFPNSILGIRSLGKLRVLPFCRLFFMPRRSPLSYALTQI
jgi:Leucine-rich repeat (LRR) protein